MALGLLFLAALFLAVGLIVLAYLLRPVRSAPRPTISIAPAAEAIMTQPVTPSPVPDPIVSTPPPIEPLPPTPAPATLTPDWLAVSREQAQLLSEIHATLLRLERSTTGVSGEIAHVRQDLRSSGGRSEQVRIIDLKVPFRSAFILAFKFALASLTVALIISGVVFLVLSILGPSIGNVFSSIYGG